MAQTIYPTADVSLGTWSNPTWSVVDDESDANYADSGNVRLADSTCELHAGNLVDPVSSSGHVITVRAKYATNGTRVAAVKVELFEGTTLRATLGLTTLTTSFAAYTYTLSVAEADALTYSDLHFKITGHMNSGGSGTSCTVQVSSVKLEAPGANGTVTAVAATASAAAGTPTVTGESGGSGATVNGVAATCAASMPAPMAWGGSILSPPVGTATAAGVAPTASGGAGVAGVAATSPASAGTPTVTGAAGLTAVAGTASAAGIAPSASGAATLTAAAATASAAAGIPDVSGGGATGTVSAVVGTASAAAVAPTVAGGGTVAAVKATASATGIAPSVVITPRPSAGALAVVAGVLGGRGFAAGARVGRLERGRLSGTAGVGRMGRTLSNAPMAESLGRELSGAAGSGSMGRELAGSPTTGSW